MAPARIGNGGAGRLGDPPEQKGFRIAQEELRINDRIRIPRVRVVAADGSQVGILETKDALEMAIEQDLDLVEVAPTADPPVCRIMDYGKYKYEQDVKQREARKKQTNVVVKEMKMRPKIDRHDYGTKKGHVVRFLKQGAKVKITIMFRGREAARSELGQRLLDQLAEDVSDIAKIDTPAKLDGRNMTMVLSPNKDAIEVKARPEPTKPHGREARREAHPEAETESAAEAPEPDAPEEEEEKPKRPVKVTRAEGG
jgi:translation initiation factor IF-3